MSWLLSGSVKVARSSTAPGPRALVAPAGIPSLSPPQLRQGGLERHDVLLAAEKLREGDEQRPDLAGPVVVEPDAEPHRVAPAAQRLAAEVHADFAGVGDPEVPARGVLADDLRERLQQLRLQPLGGLAGGEAGGAVLLDLLRRGGADDGGLLLAVLLLAHDQISRWNLETAVQPTPALRTALMPRALAAPPGPS